MYNKEGKLLEALGKRGSEEGEFYFPTGIVATEESIYIVDSENNRIQVFENNF